MLDLTTALGEKYYEIKLFDGSVLKLKRPTQAIQQTLIEIVPLVEASQENQLQIIPIMAKLFCRILNRNIEGKTFTVEGLGEEYDFATMELVIMDYFTYWNKEIEERVNFQHSRQ